MSHATAQVSWTVQWKSWSTWVEKLGGYWQLIAVYTPDVILPDCIDLPRKGGGELIDIEECVKKESESLHGCPMNGAK